jgi:DNA-binding transcriptional MerR regulator
MQIGELSNITGVAAHTIRFYEARGLLPKSTRGSNGYRSYDQQSVRLLTIIQCAKRLGFKLENIAEFLGDAITSNADEKLDHDKLLQRLDVRLQEVDTLMATLEAQRSEILTFKQQLKNNLEQGQCLISMEILETA